jgi:hypothetical protein
MIAQPLAELNSRLTEDARKRLSHILSDVEKGKELDIRTPFLKESTASEILEQFEVEVFDPNRHQLNGTLSEIEGNQKEKFGSRSIQKPWMERKASLLAMFDHTGEPPEFDDPIELPGVNRLRPSSLESVYGAMKRTTSSGLPYLLRKGIVLDKGLPIEPEEWPCVLFTRTQEGGKTRDVLGYPMYALSQEGLYFLPYFEIFRTHPCLAAYSGPDIVDEAISKILYTKDSKHEIYSEDFERFDQSVHPSFSARIFEFIAGQFQSGYHHGISIISDVFTNIGVVTPDGVYAKPHGIPSGSWFTSIVGSYVHLVVQNAVMQIHENKNQVMGDDGVQCLPTSIDEKYISDVYASYNLELNEDKTFRSKDEVLYLQRYYCRDYMYDGIYRGVYPVVRALNRIIHMERWTEIDKLSGADYFAIRTIAILENCKWHPMHADFVKWVARNDRYKLNFSDQGLKEFILNFQPKTSTTIRNQYSDDLSGIMNFETVKILRSL